MATATAAAGLLGGPLAAALMLLDGKLGLRGWQWLFIAEGVPPILLAAVIYLRLPSSPLAAAFLQPDERAWLWHWVHGEGGIELAPAGPAGELELGEAGAEGGARGPHRGAPAPGAGAGSVEGNHAEDTQQLLPREAASAAAFPGPAEEWPPDPCIAPNPAQAALRLHPVPTAATGLLAGASLGRRQCPSIKQAGTRAAVCDVGDDACDVGLQGPEPHAEAASGGGSGSRGLSSHLLRQSLLDWRVWYLGGVMFCVDLAMNSTHFWIPSIIRDMLDVQVRRSQTYLTSCAAALPCSGLLPLMLQSGQHMASEHSSEACLCCCSFGLWGSV